MERLSLDVVKQLSPEAEAPPRRGLLPEILRIVRGPYALRRWAVVSLIMNVLIVVTGGLVRLTESGLGCPTWPRCTEDSYVSHPQLGIHGAIEFGNRLFTLVLVIAAALTFICALLYRENGKPRSDLRWLAGGLALGIPLQGVIGGIAVLTQLNPYVVGLHLLLSMVLIALAVWLVRKTWHVTPVAASGLSLVLTRVTFVLMWLAIWLGTLVTGSGPHAGDENAPRNGLDGMLVAHQRCLRHRCRECGLLRVAAQQGGTAADLGRAGAGGHRHRPVPAGVADLAGRATSTGRIAGDCRGHQLDAFGKAPASGLRTLHG